MLEIDIIVGVFHVSGLVLFFFKGPNIYSFFLFLAWRIIQNVEILGMQPFI